MMQREEATYKKKKSIPSRKKAASRGGRSIIPDRMPIWRRCFQNFQEVSAKNVPGGKNTFPVHSQQSDPKLKDFLTCDDESRCTIYMQLITSGTF